MMRFRKAFYGLTIAALMMATPLTARAVTHAEPYDACAVSGWLGGNCEAFRDNLKFYMDIHRRGGPTNESYLFKTYWDGTVVPGLQAVLSKIAANTSKNSASQGSFYEGQNNVRAVGALQEGSAQAARDFLPSESMCRFGSLTQSLGADDAKTRAAQIAIATASLKRDLGSRGTAAQAGAADDKTQRMNEFVKEYCDRSQGNLSLMCGANPQRSFPSEPRSTRYNRDINYTRTIDSDSTLDAEFSGSALKPEEQDIISLSNNLYGSKQLSGRVTERQMETRGGQGAYMMTRSVSAARNVAQNTYAAIAAMKTKGSGSSRPYLKGVMTQLGISSTQIDAALSDKPSYYAQMDIMTKKLYQEPSFYVNLMEGKTNVARQSDAMEGLELMQDRDIYNSMRRSEMLLAVLIQLQSKKSLDDVAKRR